jgi:hypothetical protein
VSEVFKHIPYGNVGHDIVASVAEDHSRVSIEFEGKELSLDVQEARKLVNWLLIAIPTKDGS